MNIIIPSPRQQRFFSIAKRNADQSTYTRKGRGKIAIGSAIVKGNYVVSEGMNRKKTHVVQQRYNDLSAYFAPIPNIHAEVDALIKSKHHDLTGTEVFVYRELVNGTLGNCRPCRACMRALKDAGVKHIYYTTEQGFHYERI
jgi:deoxycytidylate deaminase